MWSCQQMQFRHEHFYRLFRPSVQLLDFSQTWLLIEEWFWKVKGLLLISITGGRTLNWLNSWQFKNMPYVLSKTNWNCNQLTKATNWLIDQKHKKKVEAFNHLWFYWNWIKLNLVLIDFPSPQNTNTQILCKIPIKYCANVEKSGKEIYDINSLKNKTRPTSSSS